MTAGAVDAPEAGPLTGLQRLMPSTEGEQISELCFLAGRSVMSASQG